MTRARENLFGKRVLITGASRGLGRALLEACLADGAEVYALVRSKIDRQQLEGQFPSSCHPFVADVRDDNLSDRIKSELEKHDAPAIDLILNNAGGGAKGFGIEGVCVEELRNLLDVHCLGPVRVIRGALPWLRQATTPSIVNISSRYASVSNVASGALSDAGATYSYRIAKAAQNMLSACLHQELSREQIKVYAVHPGKVKTRFGPRDATLEASEAARRILALVYGDNAEEAAGRFIEPNVGIHPW